MRMINYFTWYILFFAGYMYLELKSGRKIISEEQRFYPVIILCSLQQNENHTNIHTRSDGLKFSLNWTLKEMAAYTAVDGQKI